MRRDSDKGLTVNAATASPTEEHRKAGRAGQITLAAALVVLVISAIAVVAGFGAVAATSAGICVALGVVGLLLHYEGERQRQRPDPSQPRRGR
ncbi:MAG TPA: hypothetical protein VNX86_13830 [Rhizomicrobium sp.]|jgi:uncharacterized membrane protein YtjA (UPF0391 family)|nr:hypothetical protein [Rhizomicrobium sp.]